MLMAKAPPLMQRGTASCLLTALLSASMCAALARADDAAGTPPRVPPYGRVQFGYGPTADPEISDFLRRCHVNVWESNDLAPVATAFGWTDRGTVMQRLHRVQAQAERLGKLDVLGIAPVSYHAFFGDPDRRTDLFKLYDRYWSQFEDLLGPRPPDPLEWTARDASGSPVTYQYGGRRGYNICPNNPHWLAFLGGVLRITADSGVDGVRYDGPSAPCGACRFCQEAFRKWLARTYTATDLAGFGLADTSDVVLPVKNDDPLRLAWCHYLLFRPGQTVAETRADMRRIRPGLLMSYNYNIDNGRVAGSGRFEHLAAAGDYALVESNSNATGHAEHGRKFSVSAECKYLLAAGHGKPVNLYYYVHGDDGTPISRMADWGAERIAGAGLFWKAAIAEGMSGGCPLAIRAMSIHPRARPAVIEYADFFHERREELAEATSHASVAILASISQTCAWQPSYPLAVSRYLADHHIPHAMIIEENLTPAGLADFDALILPEARVLSDEQAAVISRFVAGGKGLAVFGSAGTYNELNRPRPGSALGPLLGIEGLQFPDAPFRRDFARGRVAWFPSVRFPDTIRAPLPEPVVTSLEGFVEALTWAAGRGFLAYLNAPEMVELNLMRGRHGDMLLVHLMNYHLEAPASVTPYENLRLGVALPEGRSARRAVMFSPDLDPQRRKLVAQVNEWHGRRYVSVTVPRIEIYNLVVVELEGERVGAN